MKNFKKNRSYKLFYKKYPYKIETRLDLGHLFRHFTPTECLNRFTHSSLADIGDYFFHKDRVTPHTKKFFLDYCEILSKFDVSDYRFRIERSHVHLYVESKTVFEQLCKNLSVFISSVSEPADDNVLEFVKSSNKKILCKEIPHNKYGFKITFKTMPATVRENLLEWHKNYPDDKLKINSATIKYLNGTHKWCQNPYIYASDMKIVMMIGLATSGYISKVEEFVPLSSINIVS